MIFLIQYSSSRSAQLPTHIGIENVLPSWKRTYTSPGTWKTYVYSRVITDSVRFHMICITSTALYYVNPISSVPKCHILFQNVIVWRHLNEFRSKWLCIENIHTHFENIRILCPSLGKHTYTWTLKHTVYVFYGNMGTYGSHPLRYGTQLLEEPRLGENHKVALRPTAN